MLDVHKLLQWAQRRIEVLEMRVAELQTDDERIQALAEGRPVGEVCPNAACHVYKPEEQIFPCKKCGTTGRIRTEPDTPGERAVVELREKFEDEYEANVNGQETLDAERAAHAETRRQLAELRRTRLNECQTKQWLMMRDERDAALARVAEMEAALRHARSDCIEHAADLARNAVKSREAEQRLAASEAARAQLQEALAWYARGIKSVQTDDHERKRDHLERGGDPECPFCDDGRRAREALAALESLAPWVKG